MPTGFIQGFCASSSGTPAAFCATVTGTFKWDTNTAQARGAGGQIVTRKGMSNVTVEFECTGVAAADMALWFPTTAGETSAGMKDFIIDDGDSQWILTGCQPGSATISKGASETDLLTFKGSLQAALATATSAKTIVWTTLTGYAKADITVSLGAQQGVNSFEITNGASTDARNPMDTRVAGALTFPSSIAITGMDPSAKIETDAVLTVTELYGDDYTASVDLVVACDNGIDTAITITVSDVVQAVYTGPVQADNIVYYSYDLKLGGGNVFNRVAFT